MLLNFSRNADILSPFFTFHQQFCLCGWDCGGSGGVCDLAALWRDLLLVALSSVVSFVSIACIVNVKVDLSILPLQHLSVWQFRFSHKYLINDTRHTDR